jgi:hypothetical protein
MCTRLPVPSSGEVYIFQRGLGQKEGGGIRGRKNREYLATFPSELYCVRMHSSVADSWKDLPANFAVQ